MGPQNSSCLLSGMSKVVTLGESYLYQEDVDLFQGKNWLNGACIHFGFCLQEEDEDLNIHFLDPVVMSWVRWQIDESEYNDFIDLIGSKDWLFIPINGAMSQEDFGNHWSLLCYSIGKNMAFHFDSARGFNNAAAVDTLKAITKVLKSNNMKAHNKQAESKQESSFYSFSDSCPQQIDGFNCGIYTLLVSRWISQYIMSGKSIKDDKDDNDDNDDNVTNIKITEPLQFYKGNDSVWLKDLRESATPEKATQYRLYVLEEVNNRKKIK